jgi:hypothetical protein
MSLPEAKYPQPESRTASRTAVRRIGWLSRVKGEQVREQGNRVKKFVTMG